MVRLLIKHDLGINRVMQNNNFSGKPCPWALRLLGHWNDFLSMILIEKYYQKKLGDVELNFTSLTPDILDDFGRIKKSTTARKQLVRLLDIKLNIRFPRDKFIFC